MFTNLLNMRKATLTFFLILGIVSIINGQSLSLKGVIKDSETHLTMPGANVLIKGTTIGATTDLAGRFTITGLKKGYYSLVVSYISYNTVTIENIRVSDQAEDLVIEMIETASSLEGVIVTANRLTNTDLSVIGSIKKAEVVTSGISAQQITKSQDKDASEVVKRIPGVSVIGNKYIRIRGLNERYNYVQLNDVSAPSMETDMRSFSFDIVPSSLIERIMIYKSPSPDLPGDFSGGVVKITTKSIPEENFIDISYGAGYRDGTSFRDFKHQENGAFFLTGFNDGKHDLPDNFPSDLRKVTPNELITAGRSLPNTWIPVTSDAGLNHSLTLTGGLRFKKNKIDIGNITSLIYSNSKAVRQVERYDYMQYDDDNDKSTLLFSFIDQEYSNNIRTGFLHNWAFRFNEDHLIEFKNFYNQLSQQQYVRRTGIHYDFNYVPENHSFDQVYRGIYTGQLSGTHILAENFTLKWIGAYNVSYRDQPDYRRYRSDVDTIEHTKTLYIPLGSASSYFLGRFYSEMNEKTSYGELSVTYEPIIKNSEFSPVIKAGLTAEDKNREFSARNIGYVRTIQSDPNLQYLSIDQLFEPENINNTTGIRIDEQSNPADSYQAANKQFAGFVVLTLPFTAKISLTGGARIEVNNQSLDSKALTEKIENNTIDILPSVNLSYSFTKKMLIRAAYGLTLNRPEFRELAPFGFYDFSYNLVKKGNKDLKNARIHNLDLRWEYYPSESEIIMGGIFYKKFINPIETQFVPGGGSGGIKDFSYDNIDGATNMGFEAEIRKSLAGINGLAFLNNVSIIFNGALIRSRVQLDNSLVRQSLNRPMQGQSPYIINMGLYYRNIKNDLQVSLLYNITGKYIFSIGFDVYPDVYQMPRSLVDITLTKGIGKHIEIKAGISDLLNEPEILLQDANNNNAFDRNDDQTIQRFSYGSLINAEISFKF